MPASHERDAGTKSTERWPGRVAERPAQEVEGPVGQLIEMIPVVQPGDVAMPKIDAPSEAEAIPSCVSSRNDPNFSIWGF